MKFKDLNSIVSGHYQPEQIALMTQEELETEILRLFKEEKKYSKDKAALYHKVYKALEVIDQIKQDFVAEGAKDLRQLYFKSFAYSDSVQTSQTGETVKETSSNLYHQTKYNIKKAHFTQPRFTSLDDINDFLKDILNNQMVTVVDGKYLQVYSKALYKISWIEEQINNQIKLCFKQIPIDCNNTLAGIEALLYLDTVTPAFLARASKKTRSNLEQCIEAIHSDKQFLESIGARYNATAQLLNDQLLGAYQNIDIYAYKSNAEYWHIYNITDNFSRPVIEIKINSNMLFELLHFNKILKMGLNDAQLKGQAFIPLLSANISPLTVNRENAQEAFIRQTLNINFEIKLRKLANRHQEIMREFDTAGKAHYGVQDKPNEDTLKVLSLEKEEIEIEFNSLRSVPISESCFQSMLQHRNSLGKQLGYTLTGEQENGMESVYFTKASLGNHRVVHSHQIPRLIYYLKYHIEHVNYCIEYTQKKHALHEGARKYLSFNMSLDWEESLKSYHDLECIFDEHRKKDTLDWAGEREMRGLSLVRTIQFCQLLNLDLDIKKVDKMKTINIDAKLEKALKYPGFEVLKFDMGSSDISPEELETVMSFWPKAWKNQYQEDLDAHSDKNMSFN